MSKPWMYMCSPSWPHPPSSLPIPSSGSSQFTSPEHPDTCIEPGLEIYLTYGNIHGEKTLESPLDCKEIKPVHPKGNHSWIFIGRNDAKAETPILWPLDANSWLIGKDWCWEGLGAGGEEDDRGWDGWMASPTQWTWVWVNSGSWWWTGRPGVLRFMGSQRVGHNWATEQNWTEWDKIQSVCATSLQLCLTLCNPMDCSPPGSSDHEILQARTLEWVGISFFSASSLWRGQTHISYVSCIGRWVLYH